MKFIKYTLIFILIFGIGGTAWFFYPQYQINTMKKQSVEVNNNTAKVSYLKYFQSSKTPKVSHLALGDSVIHGKGAKDNEDLVYQFSQKFGKLINKQIQFQNEGIDGITSGELNDLVKTGRFDEEIKKADIVTINVGGNDILQLIKNQDIYSAIKKFDQLQSTFAQNLTDIAKRVHTLNPHATIVFLELYNPLSPKDDVYPIAGKLLPKWNLNIYEVASRFSSSIVVETTKVINGEKLKNLSPDGVHPNSSGYAAISEQMLYQFKHQYRKLAV